MYYKDIKDKNIWEQLREAQLAVSDLLKKDNWRMYEKKINQENNEAEKMFIAQMRTFASNSSSRDLIYKLVEDADSLRKRLRKSDLRLSCDEILKNDIYRALSKYVGIVTITEADQN